MPSPQVTRFGPGSLESIELHRRFQHGVQQGRVVGTYRIYCGYGNEHIVAINGKYEDLDRLSDPDNDTNDTIAGELVELEIEDWFDLCDTGGEG